MKERALGCCEGAVKKAGGVEQGVLSSSPQMFIRGRWLPVSVDKQGLGKIKKAIKVVARRVARARDKGESL